LRGSAGAPPATKESRKKFWQEGSAAWCEQVNKGASRTIGCAAVTAEMLEYDRARKERGEECQADGTLKVRPKAP